MKNNFMDYVIGLLIGFVTVIIIFLLVMFSLFIYTLFGLITTLVMFSIILGLTIALGLRGF